MQTHNASIRKIGRTLAGTLALCLIGLAAGCSKDDGAAASRSSPSSSTTPSSTIGAGNVCDRKLLTADDFAGIFDEPITGTQPLAGDPQTCYFTTSRDNKVGITLRPGSGKIVLASFTSGRMNAYVTWKPMSGVGEEAIWKPDLTEVSARSGDVLCEAAPQAGTLFLSKALREAGDAGKQKKFGELCNIVFARLHLPGAGTP